MYMRLMVALVLVMGCIGPGSGKDSDPAAVCDPTATPVCDCEAPSLDIGDGNELFVPLNPGQEVVLVHGPQGGWHVLASAVVHNTDTIVRLDYTIDVLPDLTRVSTSLLNVMLANWSDCQGSYWNLLGILDVSALAVGEADTPEVLVGRELRLTLSATDGEGRVAASSVDVVAAADPSDVD